MSYCSLSANPQTDGGRMLSLFGEGKEGAHCSPFPAAPQEEVNRLALQQHCLQVRLLWPSHPAETRGTCSCHMPCLSLVLACLLFLIINQVFDKLESLLLPSAYLRCISVVQLFSCRHGFRIGVYSAQLTALP